MGIGDVSKPPLELTSVNVALESHIDFKDPGRCRTCDAKPCTYICPSRTYRETGDGTVEAIYSRCIECGAACVLACPRDNIEWSYPQSGFGVEYRFS